MKNVIARNQLHKTNASPNILTTSDSLIDDGQFDICLRRQLEEMTELQHFLGPKHSVRVQIAHQIKKKVIVRNFKHSELI